ncbi:hypothetical protein SPRG_04308 [Saprolegnia parasitica CBS 223.65]|uniref:EGF-like domain-containing protein n=1 Tax=Saprolegnia parasitica (strain CBS 223.65) TaxID=695850 RepID=A0A067CKC9_SAPPC|nr:hypothetical protein SPRG_04308 [Saprolegnia parasitica CBS 223.65]KDO31169.1 hypothetical protein SPRG_04308 [Saprolegnia parasitica CBS 223.65]|eukprot:XP_012198291.1 hypothetical protein SPRG_04308 [Saprolegnia parasitica CBS 223.65]
MRVWAPLLAPLTAAYVVQTPLRDDNFACCGGCSSSVRSDQVHLTTGARVMLWDTNVKVNPQPQCLLTFPYDPTRGESPGPRRVRSGTLVGTTFPLNHDADARCCLNGGTCTLSEDDAQGKCNCVQPWGFRGDFCQLSVYDLARIANTGVYPRTVNVSAMPIAFPDLRPFLYNLSILSSITNTFLPTTPTSDMDATLAAYRAVAFQLLILGLLGASGLCILFVFSHLVNACLNYCRCRQRPYSLFEKLVTMLLMLGAVVVLGGSLAQSYAKYQLLVQLSSNMTFLVADALPADMLTFYSNMNAPLRAAIDGVPGARIPELQAALRDQMALYTSLNQTDMPQIFASTTAPLAALALPFPIASSYGEPACASMVIYRTSSSIMGVGGATGCFGCDQCVAIRKTIQSIQLDWLRGVSVVHWILYASHANLITFAELPLLPALVDLSVSLNHTLADVQRVNTHQARMLATLTNELKMLIQPGVFIVYGLSSLVALLACAAATRGFWRRKGRLGKLASYTAQLATLVACAMTGILWTVSFCARDGLAYLDRIEANMSELFLNTSSRDDAINLLQDRSWVANRSLLSLLECADVVKVPPLPTPDTGLAPPPRYNMTHLFLFPDFSALATLFNSSDPSRVTSLFGWDESYVTLAHRALHVLLFGNTTVPSPYASSNDTRVTTFTTDPTRDGVFNASDVQLMASLYAQNWSTLTYNESLRQNTFLLQQWTWCSELEVARGRLVAYMDSVAAVALQARPHLAAMQANTSALATLQYPFQSSVSFYTSTLQTLKLADCSYAGNCAWMRQRWNELHIELHALGAAADEMTLLFAIATLALWTASVFAYCFGVRVHKPKVRVYVAA